MAFFITSPNALFLASKKINYKPKITGYKYFLTKMWQ